MPKNVVYKIVVFVILSVFVFALGVNCFAQVIQPEGMNWTYLISTSYDFELNSTDSNYKYFYLMGSTTVGANKKAYVKVELQKYTSRWETVYTIWDEDELGAAIDADDHAEDNYHTYRLKLTHRAKTMNGSTLETFTDYSYTL